MCSKALVAVITILLVLPSVSARPLIGNVADALEQAKQKDEIVVIVTLQDGSNVDQETALLDAELTQSQGNGKKFKVLHKMKGTPAFVALASEDIIKKMSSKQGIKRIVPDRIFKSQLDSSVPVMRANSLWNRTVDSHNLTGEGTAVCVIDGGIDHFHPDFSGRILDERCFLPSGCPNNDPLNASDDNGHGTHVAGIVAGSGNYTGVAPGAKLLIVKACDSSANCYLSAMSAALDWCQNLTSVHNISAITMSISDTGHWNAGDCPSYDATLENSIDNAWTNGVVFTASAGNYGGVGIGYPSCLPNATSVSASTDADGQWGGAQVSVILDIFAPGDSITATKRGGGYEVRAGTSMAAPHAAGTAAILWQNERLRGRNATPGLIEDLMKNGTGSFVLQWPRLDALGAYILREQNITMNASQNIVVKPGVGTLKFNSSTDFSEFDLCVSMAANNITIDSTQCPQYNKSARLTLNSSYTNPVPLRDGAYCDDCVINSVAPGTLDFNVSHFTSYTTGANTNLTIWDTTDNGMPFGGQARGPGENVDFYANFTNATGLPANSTTGACRIDFDEPYDGYQDMTWNAGIQLHTFTRSFGSTGTYNWKVNCTGEGDNLETSDSVDITPPPSTVPEFGTWALILALGLVAGGMYSVRTRKA